MRRRVRVTADSPGCKSITVDDDNGQPVTLRGVRSVVVNTGQPGEMPTVTVELIGPVDVDAFGRFEIPEHTRAALVELGWTPPAESGA